jgi:hypothetical protein
MTWDQRLYFPFEGSARYVFNDQTRRTPQSKDWQTATQKQTLCMTVTNIKDNISQEMPKCRKTKHCKKTTHLLKNQEQETAS